MCYTNTHITLNFYPSIGILSFVLKEELKRSLCKRSRNEGIWLFEDHLGTVYGWLEELHIS